MDDDMKRQIGTARGFAIGCVIGIAMWAAVALLIVYG